MTENEMDAVAKKVVDEIVARFMIFLDKLEGVVNEKKSETDRK